MQSDIKKREATLLLYLIAFLLPVLMYLGMCLCIGRAPFGEFDRLMSDAPNQYLQFFSYLKSIASGENDLFYTFSKTLGGDMIGILSYYLLSPLNLPALLFPLSGQPLALSLIITIKLGLCGLTMAIFLTALKKPSCSTLAFSTAYAFTSFNMAYCTNLMWFDAVYMLPVVVLGLYRIFKGRGIRLYTLALCYVLICNYYTGYMVCLFSVIVFVFLAVQAFLKGEGRSALKTVPPYILGSLLAGAMAALVLLPTALSLEGNRAISMSLGLYRIYPFQELVYPFFHRFMYEEDWFCVSLPLVYCGVLSTVSCLMYFINPSRPLVQRLCSLVFLLGLVGSLATGAGFLLWHCMSYPNFFLNRCAFIMSFSVLTFAWIGFSERNSLDRKRVIITGALLLALTLLLRFSHTPKLTTESVWLTAGLTMAITVFFALPDKLRSSRFATAVILILQICVLLDNAVFIDQYFSKAGTLDTGIYAKDTLLHEQTLATLNEYDPAFYRIAEMGDDINAPMKYGFAGLSHFSSTEKLVTKSFLSDLGVFHHSTAWVYYEANSTQLLDSFLGVKYILGHLPEQKNYHEVYLSEDNLSVYENPCALPLGFVSNHTILDTSLKGDNPFALQNNIFSAILGKNSDILLPIKEMETRHPGLEKRNNEAKGLSEYSRTAEDGCIVYRFTVEESMPIYVWFEFDAASDFVLTINDKQSKVYGPQFSTALCLGSFDVGETVEIRIKSPDESFLAGPLVAYYEDSSALSRSVYEINDFSSDSEITKLSSSHLRWKGIVNKDDSALFFSIPLDKGWVLTIDGKKQEMSAALGLFCSVPIESGEHIVELCYTPPGFYEGMAISVLAAIAFVLVTIKEKRKL